MNFSRLVNEWAWRVNDGMPDPLNRTHVEFLRDVLRESGYAEDFIMSYTQNLTEAGEDDKIVKYKDKDGNAAEMKASAAKKQSEDHPAKIAWQKTQDDDTGNSTEKPDPQKLSGTDFDRSVGKEKESPEKETSKTEQPKREISGKNKTLSKGNPSETDEFNKELDTSPTGDVDFANKNEKNSIPPPYKLPESISDNPKFPKRYAKALERMMNTQANKETSNWKYFSDLPGGAGRISAQAGELMTMVGSAMSDEEFEEFASSLEKHEQSQIENNPKLKKEGSRIITKSWITATRKSRKAILDRVKKQYGEDAEILASSWDAEGEVEAMGLSNYKENKGFSTDMYLKIRKPDGEEVLDEISLKKDKNINFINSGLGDMVNDWDPELQGTLTDPKEYSKGERSRLVTGAKAILTPKAQAELESQINSTESGKGSRSKSKAILNAIKQAADEGNSAAIKYLKDDDATHRKMQEDVIEQFNTNSKVRDGLIKNINLSSY